MGVKHVHGQLASAESVEPEHRPEKKKIEGHSSQNETQEDTTVNDGSQNTAGKRSSDETDPNKAEAFSPATAGVHPPPYAADINMAKGVFYPEWAHTRKVRKPCWAVIDAAVNPNPKLIRWCRAESSNSIPGP